MALVSSCTMLFSPSSWSPLNALFSASSLLFCSTDIQLETEDIRSHSHTEVIGQRGQSFCDLHLTLGLVFGLEVIRAVVWGRKRTGSETTEDRTTRWYVLLWQVSVGSVRENRSKLFFSSGFLFTWQVSRLSLAGGLLAWETRRRAEGRVFNIPWTTRCSDVSAVWLLWCHQELHVISSDPVHTWLTPAWVTNTL